MKNYERNDPLAVVDIALTRNFPADATRSAVLFVFQVLRFTISNVLIESKPALRSSRVRLAIEGSTGETRDFVAWATVLMPLNTLMGENRILGAGAGMGLAVEDLSSR